MLSTGRDRAVRRLRWRSGAGYVSRWFGTAFPFAVLPSGHRLKILFTADIHIGRRSSRLPVSTDDGSRHSCAAAWGRIVDCAIAEKVDLVVASGDLVDEANRFLEAIGPLERGLQRLRASSIETVVVSGNHDHDVLPAIADQVGEDGIRLLGRRGVWERYTFERAGERVHLDGWSFPRGRMYEGPLAGYAPAVDDRAPILTLLHGDVENPGSPYAPVFVSEMRRFPAARFLLGHVHGTRKLDEPGGASFLYAGSPQAMDPGETGAHGVWILESGVTGFSARHIALSTVRYEGIEVSVAGMGRAEEAEGRVYAALRERLDTIVGASSVLESVRFRTRITGTTRFQRAIEERLTEHLPTLEVTVGTLAGTVESVRFAMRPERDLESLAKGVGAPAVLARLLLSSGTPPSSLRDELRARMNEIHGSSLFLAISGDESEFNAFAASVDEELTHAASVLLEELLDQKVTR